MQIKGTAKAATIRTSKLASDYGLTIQDAHLLKYSGKAIKIDNKIAAAMINDGLAVEIKTDEKIKNKKEE